MMQIEPDGRFKLDPGEAPNILLTPCIDASGKPFVGKTLVVSNPYLYVYVRDLLQEGGKKEPETPAAEAMANFVKELMKYKPAANKTAGEKKLGPTMIRLENHFKVPLADDESDGS
jgi:hypothetical protein